MKLSNILVALLISIIIMSCEEKNDLLELTSEEYLIFGRFHGECIGEDCVEIYKLTENELFEDITDKYPNQLDFHDGNYVLLEDSKYTLVSDLLDSFPIELLNENDTVLGCPDCYDQGGLYVEYNISETHKFWLIDQSLEYLPSYLYDFISIVDQKIKLINSN